MPVEHEHYLDGVSRKDDKAWEELYSSVYNGSLNYIHNKQASTQIHQKWFDDLQLSE